ncbi:YhcN/YlaJ family sporulation lipoprotein [Paraliobacillus sediminis]|uniref:YhcN/YlaJ family sporulation lipoprotein n=1 Tax=Paraliobacillus sediminis TaxID=1885916 RepID=UPI000E3BF49D|nr:YhcN/YlaJ family sporulation lipoprotein [Paraliobacillus sediminis]
MSKIKVIWIITSITLFPFLTGCNQEDANPPLINKQSDMNMQQIKNEGGLIEQANLQEINDKILSTFNSVEDVVSLKNHEDMLIAIKTTAFQQFNEQQIEQDVKKEMEKIKPKLNILVSSDQKIFIEINKLVKDLQNGQFSIEDFDKRFDKIKKLKNDTA